MAIYVDTNILPRWGTLTAPHLAALLAVAKTTSNRIVLPSLVVEESVSARRRGAEEAFEALSAAHKRASRFSGTVTTYIPSPEDVANEWSQDLAQHFETVDTPPDIALEALRREAHRHPPASRGSGARDAAIWLTVVYDCKGSADVCYFVSENTRDFSSPDALGDLHPALLQDLPDGLTLKYTTSVDALVAELATQVSITESADSLLQSALVREALLRRLDLDVLPRVTVRRVDNKESVTGDVYAVEPIRIERLEVRYNRAYDIADSRYGLIGFGAVAGITVGVFARRKLGGLELVLPVVFSLQGRAWLTIDNSGEPVEAEIPYFDRVVPRTIDTDFVVSVVSNLPT